MTEMLVEILVIDALKHTQDRTGNDHDEHTHPWTSIFVRTFMGVMCPQPLTLTPTIHTNLLMHRNMLKHDCV